MKIQITLTSEDKIETAAIELIRSALLGEIRYSSLDLKDVYEINAATVDRAIRILHAILDCAMTAVANSVPLGSPVKT